MVLAAAPVQIRALASGVRKRPFFDLFTVSGKPLAAFLCPEWEVIDVSSRPQNKNLISLNDRSPEEAYAIRSAGGKASQEKRRRQKEFAELLQLYSELPVLKGKARARLEKLGIADEDLTQKALVVDALVQVAQLGNVPAIQLYVDLLGENGGGAPKENNLLTALLDGTKEDINADDIPELKQTAESSNDMVESAGVSEL